MSVLRVVFVGIFLFVSSVAYAADFQFGGVQKIATDDSFTENTYFVGEKMSMEGTVAGDLVVVAREADVSGVVEDDVLLAVSQKAEITGEVRGDVRVIARTLTLSGKTERDAILLAGSVYMTPEYRGAGDMRVVASRIIYRGEHIGPVRAWGNTIEINGEITGDVFIVFQENLVIGDNARIHGAVHYTGPKEARISKGAVIDGIVVPTIEPTRAARIVWPADLKAFTNAVPAFIFLSTLVGSLVLVSVFPRFSSRTSVYIVRKGPVVVWYGLLFGVGVLLTGFIGMLSVFGFHIGFLLLFGFVAVFLLTTLLTPIFAGALLSQWITKEMRITRLWTLVGLIALEVILFIPIIGYAVNTLFFLAVMGSLARGMYGIWWVPRKGETTVV